MKGISGHSEKFQHCSNLIHVVLYDCLDNCRKFGTKWYLLFLKFFIMCVAGDGSSIDRRCYVDKDLKYLSQFWPPLRHLVEVDRPFKMIGFTSDFFLMRGQHPKLPGKLRLFPENRAARLHKIYKSSVIIYVRQHVPTSWRARRCQTLFFDLIHQ